MKFILMLLLSTSLYAQDSCRLVDQIYKDGSYLDQIQAKLDNDELSSDDKLNYRVVTEIAALYGGSFASFKVARVGRKSIYLTKMELRAAKAAGDDVAKIASLEKYFWKSKLARKSLKAVGWLMLVGGTMHLFKSYLEVDFEPTPEQMLDLKDQRAREELCEKLAQDAETKKAYQEFGLKLFITRKKVEKIINQENISKIDNSNLRKVKEILSGSGYSKSTGVLNN